MKLMLPIVASIVWGVLGAMALVPALFGVMMFDAPGSEDNVWLWLVVGSMWAFPLVCTVAVVAVWGGFLAKSVVAQLVAAALPVLPIASGVVGIVLMQVLCGGDFACR